MLNNQRVPPLEKLVSLSAVPSARLEAPIVMHSVSSCEWFGISGVTWLGLREKTTGKPMKTPYIMGTSMVSCTF
jgi:hypothetical protein